MTKKDIFQVLGAFAALALLAYLFIFLYSFSHVAAWTLFVVTFVAAEELVFGFLTKAGGWIYRKIFGK